MMATLWGPLRTLTPGAALSVPLLAMGPMVASGAMVDTVIVEGEGEEAAVVAGQAAAVSGAAAAMAADAGETADEAGATASAAAAMAAGAGDQAAEAQEQAAQADLRSLSTAEALDQLVKLSLADRMAREAPAPPPAPEAPAAPTDEPPKSVAKKVGRERKKFWERYGG